LQELKQSHPKETTDGRIIILGHPLSVNETPTIRFKFNPRSNVTKESEEQRMRSKTSAEAVNLFQT
jgi:hypothetical protein